MKLVLVESPAKAKTINKYLGPDFDVMATIGHIRNLPNKNGVNPDNNFQMEWELIDRGNKFLKDIKFVKADISKKGNWERNFKGAKIIFHLAALADIVPSIQNPSKYFNSNVLGIMSSVNKVVIGIKPAITNKICEM